MAEVEAAPLVVEPVANEETQLDQSNLNETQSTQSTESMTSTVPAEVVAEVIAKVTNAQPSTPEAQTQPSSEQQTTEQPANTETQSSEQPIVAESNQTAEEEPANSETQASEQPAVAESNQSVEDEPANTETQASEQPVVAESNQSVEEVPVNTETHASEQPAVAESNQSVEEVPVNTETQASDQPAVAESNQSVEDQPANTETQASEQPVVAESEPTNTETQASEQPSVAESNHSVEEVPANTETQASDQPAVAESNQSVEEEPANTGTQASDQPVVAESNQSVEEVPAMVSEQSSELHQPEVESEQSTAESQSMSEQPSLETSSVNESQPGEVQSIETAAPADDHTKQTTVEESKTYDEQSTQSDAKPFEESKVESEPVKTEPEVDSRAVLRQQLMDFVTYVIQYQPPDAFKQIESIMASIKANKSINFANQSTTKSSISHIVADDSERQALLAYLRSLTDKPVKPVNPDDEDAEPEEDPEPADIPEFVPHLLRDFTLFSQAGLGFSNDEYQMLDRALISLAQNTEGLESVRFWGKLFALNGKDYYIAECKKTDYSAEEETDRTYNEKILNETGELVAERCEVWGAGANEFVYYVCQSIQQSINPWVPTKWVALPSVAPLQIKAARGSRRLLTGDLDAPVGGFPRFPGNESHYLRTQIARISHSTIVAPTGAWKEEEGGIVMENDEFKAHPVNEAVSWQHIRGHLRGEGRVEPFVDDEAEQTEEENSALPKEPVEPLVPALRSTVDDIHSVGPRVWSYRASLAVDCGFQPSAKPAPADDDEEDAPPASEPHCCYSAHSLLWPGAVSVVHGRNYASCYVGWGLKRDRNTPYRPPPPAPFQREYAQPMVEQIEPKPTEVEQEELRREAEEEAERKKEEGEQPVEEEDDDPLPDDEEEEPQDE